MQKKRALFPIVCLLFVALGLSGMARLATAQDQSASVSFRTPEEAIMAYMQGVTQGDIAQILQACAVDEMGDGFNFELHTNRLQALTMLSPAPSTYPLYAEMNKVQFSWQILSQARNLAYALLATENRVVEGQTVLIDPEGTLQFIDEVNPERLDQLQVVKIGLPNPELATSERNLQNWNTIAQIYGAEELTERVALFLFEGNTYLVGFALLRYGDNWKISNASSTLAGLSSFGTPSMTSEDAFDELIGSR